MKRAVNWDIFARPRYFIFCLLFFLCLSLSFATGPDDGLAVLELRVLGQKFLADPVDLRVARLERALKQPALAYPASIEQRLSNLYMTQQTYVSEIAQGLAIKAYNQGIDASEKGEASAAITLYQKAIDHNPLLIPAYNNLATVYENQQQYERAVDTYRSAIERSPNDPILRRNLGVVFEKSGRITEALQTYKEYLALSPTPDPAITDMVESVESKRGATGQADYLAVTRDASSGKRLIWPRAMNPIPVYIAMEAQSQAPFYNIIEQSLQAWTQATLGRLQFKTVQDPKLARILVYLQNQPVSHPYENVGHAQYFVSDTYDGSVSDLRVTIHVNTGEPGTKVPLSERALSASRFSLHEIGHAIGIWGHSGDPNDVMYARPIVNTLSSRDMTTIQKLYSLYR